MAKAYAQAWHPVFAVPHSSDSRQSKQLLQEFKPDFDAPLFAPPSSDQVRRFLETKRPSAPGPDGLAGHVWLHAGPSAHHLLANISRWLSNGFSMGPTFNETLFVCISKAAEDGDEDRIVRDPLATRPLGLKHEVVKIPVGIGLRAFAPVLHAHAARSERGFIPGRNFLSNIIEFGALARLVAMHDVNIDPVILCTDFTAASPCISQQWTERVLMASRLPDGAKSLLVSSFKGSSPTPPPGTT